MTQGATATQFRAAEDGAKAWEYWKLFKTAGQHDRKTARQFQPLCFYAFGPLNMIMFCNDIKVLVFILSILRQIIKYTGTNSVNKTNLFLRHSYHDQTNPNS